MKLNYGVALDEEVDNTMLIFNPDNIDVLSPGYIITPEGDVIELDEDYNHNYSLSKFINLINCDNRPLLYDLDDAINFLLEQGYVIYSGIRYDKGVNKVEFLKQVILVLMFPNNIVDLGEKQKRMCKKLINTNKSRLFKGREKTSIEYGTLSGNIYTKEQIIELLSTKNKVLKKEKGDVRK